MQKEDATLVHALVLQNMMLAQSLKVYIRMFESRILVSIPYYTICRYGRHATGMPIFFF